MSKKNTSQRDSSLIEAVKVGQFFYANSRRVKLPLGWFFQTNKRFFDNHSCFPSIIEHASIIEEPFDSFWGGIGNELTNDLCA